MAASVEALVFNMAKQSGPPGLGEVSAQGNVEALQRRFVLLEERTHRIEQLLLLSDIESIDKLIQKMMEKFQLPSVPEFPCRREGEGCAKGGELRPQAREQVRYEPGKNMKAKGVAAEKAVFNENGTSKPKSVRVPGWRANVGSWEQLPESAWDSIYVRFAENHLNDEERQASQGYDLDGLPPGSTGTVRVTESVGDAQHVVVDELPGADHVKGAIDEVIARVMKRQEERMDQMCDKISASFASHSKSSFESFAAI